MDWTTLLTYGVIGITTVLILFAVLMQTPLATPMMNFLLEIRWMYVVPLVLPMSWIHEQYWILRDWYYYTFKADPAGHVDRVKAIQAQIKAWHAAGKPGGKLTSARHSNDMMSPNHKFYKKKDSSIYLPLFDVLEVDEKNMTVIAEPRVNMGRMSKILMNKGFCLPIVPEMDDLTVGGLINGYGIEGSSHKYGLFADIVESMDVVLGNGELVTCSPTKNADLFFAIPWSYGSLGFVVRAVIRLQKFKPYVKLRYLPCKTLDECVDTFNKEVNKENPHEYVEAIMYTKETGVVMIGDLVEKVESGYTENACTRWYKPWFYKHVQTKLDEKEADNLTEFIPSRHYWHRHTRSIFWEGELIVPFGNHWLFRLLLGWMMPPKIRFLKMTEPRFIRKYYANKHIIQEGLFPTNQLKQHIEAVDKIFEVYPVWLCPHKLYKTQPQGLMGPPQCEEGKDYEMYVDLGFWFAPGKVLRGEDFDAVEATKAFEKYLRENRCFQSEYADVYQSMEEWETMWNIDEWEKARRKYHGITNFLHPLDKIGVNRGCA